MPVYNNKCASCDNVWVTDVPVTFFRCMTCCLARLFAHEKV